jgi:hypothetical protein
VLAALAIREWAVSRRTRAGAEAAG